MRAFVVFLFSLFSVISQLHAQSYSLSGKVVNEKNLSQPVDFAAIMLPDQQLWATANDRGEFFIRNIRSGKVKINISCLGFEPQTVEIDIHTDVKDLVFKLKESNLSLSEVVITAKEKTEAATSSYTIDRAALDHLQTQTIADITSLLPGGKTLNTKYLASADPQQVAIRSISKGGDSHSLFGTAIEVDGVRLSTNSSFEGLSSASTNLKGLDVRNISSTNIESVEVVTGVPSVEYGDVSNGMVKVNTKQGKTPLTIELSTRPNTKQYAINKGFVLTRKGDILNVSFERTSSISDIASPYTTYDRNGLTLRYTNTFNKSSKQPIKLTAGIAGNLGGFNTEADPDAYSNEYRKIDANTLRGNFKMDWLLNKNWITNVELNASAVFSDQKEVLNVYQSSSSSTVAIHAKKEGYYVSEKYEDNPNAAIVIIPRGVWFEQKVTDNKPKDYNVKLKANWARRMGRVGSFFLLGGEYSYSKNAGKGSYYRTPKDEKYTYYVPTWREYRYKDQPGMNNLSFFAEERISIPIQASTLELVGGVRSDITSVSHSAYGTVSSLSPRLNAKYTFWDRQGGWLKKLTVRAGWGKSVKLPSLGVLNPQPTYTERISFSSASDAEGTAYSAYHVYPVVPLFNPDLKWQHSGLTEVGVEARFTGVRVSLTAFHNKIGNPYKRTSTYLPYSYKFTDQSSLNNVLIPASDRIYAIDHTTGVVTVSDKAGANPTQELVYKERALLRAQSFSSNASSTVKKGLEWVFDFDKIPGLNTSFRLDGSYYYYRGVDETLNANSPGATQLMTDGNYYKYVGYYIGGTSSANGRISKQLNTNLTVVTHIPKIRLIVSLRLEGSLYNSTRNLSEYSEGERSGRLADRNAYDLIDGSIYDSDHYIAMYPLYYSSIEDMSARIPFKESFLAARESDPTRYNELSKMVIKTPTSYFFNKNKLSPYFVANLSITKEIGKYVSLSFDARNFTNTMAKVKQSAINTYLPLYGSSYIPSFYYGLALRIKL